MKNKIQAGLRKAKPTDINEIFEVEIRAWPPELRATKNALLERINAFPNGFWVAVYNKKIIGFFSSVPTDINSLKPDYKKILANRNPHYLKWLDEFKAKKQAKTLFVMSTCVLPEFQGKGIGKKLVLKSLEIAKQLNCRHRASVLRLFGYGKFRKQTNLNAEKFLQGVKQNKFSSELGLYTKLGFNLSKIIKNYQKDKAALNHGLFSHKKV